MESGQHASVLRFLRGIAVPHGTGDATDGQLLHRFASRQDEAAFTALLRRHGPMVLGVCRRVLPNPDDAEDAFQATFLVLALKAGSVADSGLLGNWLHGVACRTALKARADAARRRVKERVAEFRVATDTTTEAVWADLRPVLDEEVNRLPGKYRLPFVLCYLEGRTNAEAAGLLGCPEGTVASRLAWARQRLRSRLARRGLAPCAGLLAAGLPPQAVPAPVPPELVGSTMRAATLVAAGKTAGAAVPAKVVALAEGVLHTMLMSRVQAVAVVLLALALVGVARVATSVLRAEDRKPETPQAVAAPVAAPLAARAEADGDEITLGSVPPVVVRTVPEAGSDSVDPKLTEIKVTFSKEMSDGSWSFSTLAKENFPQTTGKPKYLDDKRTCVLPVKLEPGKTYAMWLNSAKFGNFKDTDGRSAVPYLLVFQTKK
jgi:RNA polymerase sigma-70 factor (ECF subfamily)